METYHLDQLQLQVPRIELLELLLGVGLTRDKGCHLCRGVDAATQGKFAFLLRTGARLDQEKASVGDASGRWEGMTPEGGGRPCSQSAGAAHVTCRRTTCVPLDDVISSNRRSKSFKVEIQNIVLPIQGFSPFSCP